MPVDGDEADGTAGRRQSEQMCGEVVNGVSRGSGVGKSVDGCAGSIFLGNILSSAVRGGRGGTIVPH